MLNLTVAQTIFTQRDCHHVLNAIHRICAPAKPPESHELCLGRVAGDDLLAIKVATNWGKC